MSDEFTSHGAALDDEGMENALDLAKVSAAQLWAVLAVETSGNGSFPTGARKSFTNVTSSAA
jgi:hypothetical protein